MPHPTTFPNTRSEVDALPYRPEWGQWGITAWAHGSGYRKLAEVWFPVVNGGGPFASYEVKCMLFAQLDNAARRALSEMEVA
jgi:hypothetical protein